MRLSELVRQVQSGESFIIARRGKPAAELAPVRNLQRHGPKRVAEGIRRIRAMKTIGGVSHDQLRSWIEDGRD